MARAPRALTQEALSHIARVRDKLVRSRAPRDCTPSRARQAHHARRARPPMHAQAAYGVERQRDDQWRYIEECLLAMPDARRSLSVADLCVGRARGTFGWSATAATSVRVRRAATQSSS